MHGLAWLSPLNCRPALCGAGFQLSSLFQNVTQDQVFRSRSTVCSSSFLDYQTFFCPNLVILDRLQRYPDLVGLLGTQISFSEDSEEFSFVTPL
jgi:hypothetical protein